MYELKKYVVEVTTGFEVASIALEKLLYNEVGTNIKIREVINEHIFRKDVLYLSRTVVYESERAA